jgi:hypothetical protein
MSERPRVLEQLGDELDRVAGTVLGEPGGARGLVRRPARRLSVLAVCLLLLVLAAAAAAAVLLIQQGSPLPAPHAQDLRASGIPLPASAHLAGLDAPDPDGSSPPWDLRLSRTSGGETCTAVGQVYDGQFGIVGLDHVFRALPLGSVDSCGIDSGAKDEPLLVGAKSFVGATPAQARTVLSGIAGQEARSVTVSAAGGPPRRLRLGPQGSFITVYAGEAEALQPRVMIALRDGRMRTVELERSGAFEVPDPEGGGAWSASSEPDLEANAFPDEDCVQVTRQPSQSEPSHVTLALTPEVCGRLGTSPLFVQMRRFVPGEASTRFPWGNTPSRTVVYGVAAPRVKRLELSGAGATRSLQIDPRGGAFVAVLDGHIDPRSLTLTATLRNGTHIAYQHPTGLLESQTNKPIPTQPVPAYRAPLPISSTLPPPFEFPIAATVKETLRSADPAGGPEWVLRSWQGKPNTHVSGVADEQFLCIQLGVLYHGKLVEPTATPSVHSLPLSSEGGRCNQAKDLNRMHYTLTLESFLDDPYQYTPHPARAVLSGMLPPGASHPILLGAGPARPLPLDANNAFLVVLPGRYWDAHPRISYVLDGHRVGKLPGGPGPRLYQHGIETKIPQVRAPDPDGAAPWGLTATRDCTTAVGRIVAGRLASIDLSNGVLQAGSDFSSSSSSCATHPEAFTPTARQAEQKNPVEFDEQQVGAGESPLQTQPHLRQPEIQWRTLPGRTILTGIARPDVTSITLSSPSDMRTLRPTGPLHTILAVYDGYFLRGNLTATIRLHNGHVQTERIASFGAAYYPPEPLNVQLREARQTLQQMHARTRTHTAPRGIPVPLFEAHIHAIERRLAYEHAHPGLLPAG